MSKTLRGIISRMLANFRFYGANCRTAFSGVFEKRTHEYLYWPNIPDSIAMTEGRFHLKIKKP
jgi:hypothetical protein